MLPLWMHEFVLRNNYGGVETQILRLYRPKHRIMITEKATYYLVYAALVIVTFLIDNMLLKKTDKTSRTLGYILSIIVDLAMFGFGIWLYKVKGEDQTGFVLGGILCGVCLLCLLGRYWQNKEADKRDKLS